MKNQFNLFLQEHSLEIELSLCIAKFILGTFLVSNLFYPIRKALTSISVEYFLSTCSNREAAKVLIDDFVSRVLLGDYGFFANSLYHINFWSGLLSVLIVTVTFVFVAYAEKKLCNSKSCPERNEVR